MTPAQSQAAPLTAPVRVSTFRSVFATRPPSREAGAASTSDAVLSFGRLTLRVDLQDLRAQQTSEGQRRRDIHAAGVGGPHGRVCAQDLSRRIQIADRLAVLTDDLQ